MEFRIVRVGGWEFQIQVLPEVKIIRSIHLWDREKALPHDFAAHLAIQLLND